MKPTKVCLLYSGGPDSTTLLYKLLSEGNDVITLTFNFGEKEGPNEQQAASAIAKKAGVINHHVDFSLPLRKLYNLPSPQFLRHPEKPPVAVQESDSVQPFGSAIALLLAASYAAKLGINLVYYAVHAGDSIYQDNRQEYFSILSDLTESCEGDDLRTRFCTPLLNIPKHDVIRLGNNLGVPFDMTWSCAVGGTTHCGECMPCTARRESFTLAGVPDPTRYNSQSYSIAAIQ